MDWIRGGEVEAEYDPYLHRNLPKPVTYAESMINMLKGAIGAGMLAMPNAISRLGIIVGAVGIFVIAAYATYCILLMVESQYQVCKKWRRGYIPYPESVQLAVESGPPCMRCMANLLGTSVDIFLFIFQIGVCAIFCVFVSENIKQLMAFYGQEEELRLIIIYLYPVQMLMCSVKELKRLTVFSTIANISVMIGVFLLFFYLMEDDLMFEESQLDVKGIIEIPIFIGMVLFALQAPGVVLACEHNMEKPGQFVGPLGLFSLVMIIISFVYAAIGVFGFLKYGNDCKGSITLNLPPHEKKAQAAKLLVALSIYLSYPLQNYVAWEILWRKLSAKPKNATKGRDYFARFLACTLPFCGAVASPSLGALMGLIGALCISVVAIILPAIMDICICYPNKYGAGKYKLYVDIIIVITGFLCCCSGVFTSLREMIGET